jgi:DNA-binding response OmpR family regulator
VEASDAPELLVLDWMMPEIDGLEVCRRIRTLRKHVYPYILLLTAKNAKQDLILGLDAGADDYLTKPSTWTKPELVTLNTLVVSAR